MITLFLINKKINLTMSFSGKKMTCDLILAKITLFGFLLLFF